MADLRRCPWGTTEQYIEYHDREWGVPVQDNRTLLEFLILEGAQAGLSWATILKKRDNYREAFDHFDPVTLSSAFATESFRTGASSCDKNGCDNLGSFSSLT